MAILKLKEAGEEAVLGIVSVEIVKGDYGEQVKFDTEAGDTLYVPLSSVERQLDRIGVDEIEELAGRILHFSRAASKPGKAPYWNIDKARPEDFEKKPANGKTATNGAPKEIPGGEMEGSFTPQKETGAPPEESVSAFDALVLRYGECLDAVSELLANRNMKVDSQAYSAMVATIYISRNQARV